MTEAKQGPPALESAPDDELPEPGRTKSDALAHAAGARASLHHSPASILVVDDDASVRESLGEVLREERYDVRFAFDGREAVRQFLDGPPDVILLDVNMPDITGWQTFEILAQLYPFVPVLMMTARPGQARRAAELGVKAFMEKPLDIYALLRTVRELLEHPDTAHFGDVLRRWPTTDLWGAQG